MESFLVPVRLDDTYYYVKNDAAYSKDVEFEDALGFKAKLSFDVGQKTRAYVALNHAGIVADSGDQVRDFGTELPYSSLGNKREYEVGARFTSGNYTLFPRLLYRENIIDANPNGTGLPRIKARNIGTDPFSVLGNRSAKSAELYLPTTRLQVRFSMSGITTLEKMRSLHSMLA